MLKLTLTGPIFHFHKVSLLSEVLRTRQQAGNISTDNCFMKINGLKTGINKNKTEKSIDAIEDVYEFR